MKQEIKYGIMGILTLPVALFFIVSGLMDILSVTGGPPELLIIVPVIVTVIYFVLIGILVIVSVILKRRNILYKKVHNCRICGAAIKLEDKICKECGEENAIRYEALEKLEDSERKIIEYQAKRSEKLANSKRGPNRRERKLQEMEDQRLSNKSREIRVMKTKLITGNTHEGKLEWIKTQHYDLKRSVREIAEDLIETSLAVSKYLDEIENQIN